MNKFNQKKKEKNKTGKTKVPRLKSTVEIEYSKSLFKSFKTSVESKHILFNKMHHINVYKYLNM